MVYELYEAWIIWHMDYIMDFVWTIPPAFKCKWFDIKNSTKYKISNISNPASQSVSQTLWSEIRIWGVMIGPAKHDLVCEGGRGGSAAINTSYYKARESLPQ